MFERVAQHSIPIGENGEVREIEARQPETSDDKSNKR